MSERPRDAATLIPTVFGRVVHAEVHSTEVALLRPLGGARESTSTRSVRVLLVRGNDGQFGVGEASSVDWLDGGATTADVDRALAQVAQRIGEQSPNAGSLLRGTLDPALPGAVRSALQTALLDMQARRRGQTLAALLGATAPCSPLAVSALIGSGSLEDMASEAAGYAALGLASFKIKVGGRDLADDRRSVLAVREAIGVQAKLRLDANRAWDQVQATRGLVELAVSGAEFLEEPLRAGEDSALPPSSLRVALDESIRNADDLTVALARGGFQVLVLKLERVGGPIPALALAQTAMRNGLEVVFTDSIESAVGRAATVHVAAAAAQRGGRQPSAVGLGGLFLLRDGSEPCATVEVRGPGLGLAESVFLGDAA